MDVKKAVTLAKEHVLELFADEKLTNLGLEEVEFDDSTNTWMVTLGFSRPWDEPRNTTFATLSGQATTYPRRSYKVVRVAEGTEGARQVLSVKNREVKS